VSAALLLRTIPPLPRSIWSRLTSLRRGVRYWNHFSLCPLYMYRTSSRYLQIIRGNSLHLPMLVESLNKYPSSTFKPTSCVSSACIVSLQTVIHPYTLMESPVRIRYAICFRNTLLNAHICPSTREGQPWHYWLMAHPVIISLATRLYMY
jgi:hypothetical protein